MADFAIVRDDTVVNVVVAEDEGIAKAVTGLAVLPIVNGVPGMGWTLETEGWRQPSPFPSWAWDGEAWNPPVDYPDDGATYVWDETQTDWVSVVVPESEPESEPAPDEE